MSLEPGKDSEETDLFQGKLCPLHPSSGVCRVAFGHTFLSRQKSEQGQDEAKSGFFCLIGGFGEKHWCRGSKLTKVRWED